MRKSRSTTYGTWERMPDGHWRLFRPPVGGRRASGRDCLGGAPAPTGDARRIAAERLSETLKEMSNRADHVPDDELESLIDGPSATSVGPRG